MVTVQNIGVQLTRPIKELAEWNFPFSQTLERYCSLFNTTHNHSFGEAGLVLQNSTAVYAHRVDSLRHKIEYFRSIFENYEHEEETQCSSKKKERKVNTCFQEFKNINFSNEMEKNIDIRTIDIKKNHMMQNTVKSKCYRFTQLEKSSMQNVSIDMYDVNGEVIGKKYDFRCNQNISMDGILIDEFAPQDFCTDDDVAFNKFSLLRSSNSHDTESLESSWNTSTTDSTVQENESARETFDQTEQMNNDGSLEEEVTENTSLSSNQQTSSLSEKSDRTVVETPITPSDCQETTFVSSMNLSRDTSSPIPNIDSSTSNNNDSDARYSDDLGSPLDSPLDRRQSIDSKEKQTLPADESEKLLTSSVLTTPRSNDTKNKLRLRNSTSRSSKRKLSEKELRRLRSPRKKRSSAIKMTPKRLLEESCSSPKRRLNMLEKSLSACVKSIQEYYAQQYEDVTNETTDLLGFRLREDIDDDAANIDDNVMTISNDDEIHVASPVQMSPSHRSPSSDIWLPTDYLVSESVDKWHESIQPKLHEAERRSTFCIRDYASRIMNVLKADGQQKINFDSVVQKESSYEVARYFLASLDLASRQNVDIIKDTNLEHNIEIVFRGENKECLADNQTTTSHDQTFRQIH